MWMLSGRLQSGTRVISMYDVHKHLSLVPHPFCSDGSSTGVLASCLQTDSGNRNTQWPIVFYANIIGVNRITFYQ